MILGLGGLWSRARAAPADALRALQSPDARRITFTLAIGTVGALIAYRLHVPLAFMLGSLFATMAASMLRAPVTAPMRLRSFCFVIIGLFLSEGFTAEIAASAVGWWPSLLLALLYPFAGGALCYALYARVQAMPRADAFFSAIPGGLSGVVFVSGAYGADERNVALSHALRISMIVLVAPAFFFGVLGYQEPSLAVAAENRISFGDAALLGAAAIGAVLGAARLGLPLPQLIAPLFIGALLRMLGVVEGQLPELLVEAALIVLGASIGARFVGARLANLRRLAFWTMFGTAAMVLVSILFATIAWATTGADILPALLAFAPGGVAEMTLIAIALESDPAYVAAHHLLRLAFILLVTPFIAAPLTRWLDLRPVDA